MAHSMIKKARWQAAGKLRHQTPCGLCIQYWDNFMMQRMVREYCRMPVTEWLPWPSRSGASVGQTRCAPRPGSSCTESSTRPTSCTESSTRTTTSRTHRTSPNIRHPHPVRPKMAAPPMLSLKEGGETKKRTANLLPCRIHHDGSIDPVGAYWMPVDSTGTCSPGWTILATNKKNTN